MCFVLHAVSFERPKRSLEYSWTGIFENFRHSNGLTWAVHAVFLIRSTSFFQISCFLFFRVFSDLLLLKMLLKFSKKPGAKRGSNHLQNTLINLILTKNYNSHNNTEWKTKKLDMEEFVSSTTTKQLHRFLLNSECFLFSKAEI